MWNESDMKFQCWDKEIEAKSVTVNNQEGEFGIEEIDLETEDKSGLNLFKRQVDSIRYHMEIITLQSCSSFDRTKSRAA